MVRWWPRNGWQFFQSVELEQSHTRVVRTVSALFRKLYILFQVYGCAPFTDKTHTKMCVRSKDACGAAGKKGALTGSESYSSDVERTCMHKRSHTLKGVPHVGAMCNENPRRGRDREKE